MSMVCKLNKAKVELHRLTLWKQNEKLVHNLCNAWTFQTHSVNLSPSNPWKVIDKADKAHVLKAEYNLRRQELRRAMSEGRSKEYTDIRKNEVSFRANVSFPVEGIHSIITFILICIACSGLGNLANQANRGKGATNEAACN